MQTIIFAGVFTVLAVATWVRFTGTSTASRAAHGYARKVDLALEGELGERVAVRLAHRERTGALGAVVGVWLTVLLVATLGPGLVSDAEGYGVSSYGVIGVVMGFFAGHAVGYGVVAWREAMRPVPDGPRLARTTTPSVEDYVAPHERRGAWVAAGVSVLVAAGLALVHSSGIMDLGPMPWGAVVLAVLVPPLVVLLEELASRRVVARRQVAASTLELAWDDALRARTVRDLVTVALVIGCFGSIGLLGLVADGLEGGWPANPAVGLVNGLFLVLLGALVLTALISLVLDPQGHVRRRLWPVGQDGVRR
ncbi:hypothetical protein J4G33_14500 [Actinotalea sp. BY-33]|uniref:Uncharacterized protein n=1 Tax=Actinotalea soli TaxID=2819234 RepID=A0A939LU32_9CELL|nr:hypothetical protein [Actinotalea soli]MBO1753020.1 hypothetical protein [Actinotalea soli]